MISVILAILVLSIITGAAIYAGLIMKKNKRGSSEPIDEADITPGEMKDIQMVRSGTISGSNYREKETNQILSDLIEEVVEGREMNIDDDLIIEDLHKMRRKGEIEEDTWIMIQERMQRIT
jgi:hypothetical protein